MPQWQASLALAQSQAQGGSFAAMLLACEQIIEAHSEDAAALLDVGSLLEQRLSQPRP